MPQHEVSNAFATAGSESADTDAADRIKELELEKSALGVSLTKARVENSKLDAARQSAEQQAEQFKALAAQTDPTNKYPTIRHVAAGMGKLAARAASLEGLSGDESKLTEEQRNKLLIDGLSMLTDVTQLAQAGLQYKQQGLDQTDNADAAASLLYGALDLNEQQFSQAYGILQKYQSQAGQQNLLNGDLSPEAQAQLNQLNQNATTEIQQFLTPEQAGVFQNLNAMGQGGGRTNHGFNLINFKMDGLLGR